VSVNLEPAEKRSSSTCMFRRHDRRVNQESVLLLGGGRAILLQLAHPCVAAGVADHSDFQSNPLGRLAGTLELMHGLVFGSRAEVEEGVRRYHAVHARIHGHLSEDAGPFPAGTHYTAADPHLKLWVHATLVDTSLMIYERFIRRLSDAEREEYYRDTLILATLLDIPEAVLPRTLGEFRDYMSAMMASDTLTVSGTARELAWSVLDPDVGPVQYACARLLRFVTAGLLPARLRSDFGLTWHRPRQTALNGLSGTTRLFRPVAPAWLWLSPQLQKGGLLNRLLWEKG